MSAALKPAPMTRDEFLAWDATQDGRFEYDGLGAVAMVGGTVGHDLIVGNLFGLLWQALRGAPCRPYTGGLRIEVADRIRYPDVMVSCTPMEPATTLGLAPAVVFEVLSPGTAMSDATIKNSEYRATPSIRRYVMLDQHRVSALVFARQGEEWVGSLVEGPDAPLAMPEIGVSLRLGDLYEGVALATPPA